MELEDNRPSESAGYILTVGQDGNYGDVIEGEDQHELVLFQWESDEGLLSLRVLTIDEQTR